MFRFRHLDRLAIAIGLVLLAAYGGIRAWSAHAADAGIEALEQLRAERGLEIAANDAPNNATGDRAPIITRQEQPAFDVPAPDTTTWSQNRVAAYKEGIRRGEVPEAVLRIPALKLAVPVYDGTDELNLNRGAGRIEGTAEIGEKNGTVGIAGHRDGFFRSLKDIQIGQYIYLITPDATLTYRIVRTDIVDPSDVEVLAATSTPTIALVTCYPFYFVGSAPKRFIVRAERVTKPDATQRAAVAQRDD